MLRSSLILCFLLLIGTLLCAQDSENELQLGVSFSTGSMLLEQDPSANFFGHIGELDNANFVSILAFAQIPINQSLFLQSGIGVKYSQLAVVNQFYLVTSPNGEVRDIEKSTKASFIDTEIPLLLGIYIGPSKKLALAMGLWATYRTANFTSSQTGTTHSHGYVNVINPDGSITQVYGPLTRPYTVSSEEKNVDLLMAKFQYGIRANINYQIGQVWKRDWSLGANFDHLLSQSEFWPGHIIKSYLGFTISVLL